MTRNRMAAFFFALGLVALAASCSNAPVVVDKPLDATHEKLNKIRMAYSKFQATRNRAPQGPDDIRPLLAESGNADDLLRSARDGQPFVVCWGVDLTQPPTWAKSTAILAYEKQGVEGKRYVLTFARSVELMSDKEFSEASFPPGHKPPVQ
jgi:hypothetical protein